MPAGDFDGVILDGGPDALEGSGWGIMFAAVGPVSMDPCDQAQGTFDSAATSTVVGLVTAMSSWPGFEATADPDRGRRLQRTAGRAHVNLTSTDCPAGAMDHPTGLEGRRPIVNATGTAHTDKLRIVDVDGTLLVIRTIDFPETTPYEEEQGVASDPTRHAADQVELHEIVDSIRITVAP
jgi:hypothetical protein